MFTYREFWKHAWHAALPVIVEAQISPFIHLIQSPTATEAKRIIEKYYPFPRQLDRNKQECPHCHAPQQTLLVKESMCILRELLNAAKIIDEEWQRVNKQLL